MIRDRAARRVPSRGIPRPPRRSTRYRAPVRTRLTPRPLPLLALVALLGVPLVACGGAHLKDGVYEDARVNYRVSEPSDGWRQVRVASANAAWLHDELGASLLVNSHCEGVQDAPLEALANHLLIGWTEREVLDQRKFELSRREALEQEVSAKLDGVPRRLMLLVLKKDGCVYDVVLSAPPESFSRAKAGYERVAGSLDIGPRRDWS